jgi:hypothetical protein
MSFVRKGVSIPKIRDSGRPAQDCSGDCTPPSCFRKTNIDYSKILLYETATPRRWCGFGNLRPLRKTNQFDRMAAIRRGPTMPVTGNPMNKHKKAAKKSPTKLSANQATEQIVQMIASSIASLPKKERLAAMQAFDLTANALSSSGKKAAKPRKSPASRPPLPRRKGS